MRIYTLKDKEKKSWASVLPDSISLRDSLVMVSVDDEAENTPLAGIAVFSSVMAGIWSLDYLLVGENYRRRGVAKSLISYGRFLIKMMGGSQLLSSILDEGDADALKQCLLNAGFTISAERDVNSAFIELICDKLSPYITDSSTAGIVPLSKINKFMWKEISDSLIEMIHEDDLFVPIRETSYYRKDLSMVMLDESGLCKGLILVSDVDGDLSVDYLWSAARNGKIAVGLLAAAVMAVKDDCDVLFDAMSDPAQRLVQKLIGDDLDIRYRALEMKMPL